MQKICSKCGRKLNIREFRKDKTKRDGLYPSCNDCHRKRTGCKKYPNWGKGNVDINGYKNICGKREHRIVIEKHLGRKLKRVEHIHHKNGVKTDNRIENLEILSASEHHKLHMTNALKKRMANASSKLRYNKMCLICSKKFVSKTINAKVLL